MRIRFHVVGMIAGTTYDVAWFDTLDDAIQAIRKSSVEDGLLSYCIETYQLSSSLLCRVVDHQLFIE